MTVVILPIAPVVLCLAAAWLVLLTAAPWLPTIPSALTYVAGGLVCHQIADRSFHLGAAQLPVCARCLGIYAGVTVAALGATLRRGHPAARGLTPAGGGLTPMGRGLTPMGRGLTPMGRGLTPMAILAIGVAPTAITVVAEALGVWSTSNAVRFAAGAPAGAAAALVVLRAWPTLHYGECARRPPAASSRPPSHT